MTGGALSLVALAAVSATAPHLLARDALRARLVRVDAISTVALLGLWHVAAVLGIGLTTSGACGVFLAMKVVVTAVALAGDIESTELEWSPGRAGLIAALVFLALVPNVLAFPVDGDESFYVLNAESIIHDFDLDLRNQYEDLGRSVTKRLDLRPQFGDPVGPKGELYSRQEPLLPLLLVPGIVFGGLAGAVVSIALLAALAVRAVIALLADEGVGRRAQMVVFAFVGLAPPFLNYATRIWPEAPGALLLAEMLRAARERKIVRVIVLGVLLSALKVRFIPIAATLLVLVVLAGRHRVRASLAALASVMVVMAALWFFFPGVLETRSFDPWSVFAPDNFSRGLLGILLDGQGGLLFQAPMLMLGLVAVLRWRGLGSAAKLGCVAMLPYVFLLLPRSEWHGGWSPPLRYLVVFVPVFALLVAAAVERVVGMATVVLAAAWTSCLTAVSVAFPPGLFRIASGESALGEHLSRIWGADFSRLIPSLIRPNDAALWYAVALVLLTAFVALRRIRPGGSLPAAAAVLSLLVAAGAWAGLQPGRVIEFEDAYVRHEGGELYPEMWTVARFRFRGGWTLKTGDGVSFSHRGGLVSIEYYCDQATALEIDGEEYEVPTGPDYGSLVVVLPPTRADRHDIRCVRGALILDRLATQ